MDLFLLVSNYTNNINVMCKEGLLIIKTSVNCLCCVILWIVEFVEEGGVECIIEHKDLFTKCLDGLGDKTDLANNSVQVCQ